ncbi:MAG: PQQ-dependent sugar dehydrogenase [Actinomycetota bacterium]
MRRASLALVVVLGTLVACRPQQADAPSPSANDDSTSEAVDVGERPETVQPVTSGAAEFASLSLVEVGSLEQPVDVAARPGDDAIYFVSVTGTIHRFTSAGFDSTPVLDISDLTDGNGERGLLGLAFSNDGATGYLNYTNLNGDNTIASVAVDPSGTFDRSSLRTLLVIEQPFRNHNAGDIVVEPGGMLLVPMGDGGSADDPQRLSLDDKSMLGKILRVDPRDGTVRVLAKGLRNPWRIDLFEDRLWLADVGQNQWEEVSVLDDVSRRVGEAFGNATGGGAADASAPVDVVDFGWSAYEANMRFNDDQSSPRHTPPYLAYEHGENGCSVSGGAVATSGSLRGRYVFADYCSGRLWSVPTNAPSPSMQLHFVDLDAPAAVVRANGDVFVLSLGGTIWRLNG